MEPIGATASVITLIDVAVKTFKAINKITRSYQNAPAELIRLTHQLDCLKIQLVLLQDLQRRVGVDVLLLGNAELNDLEGFLHETIVLFSSIRDALEQQSLRTGKVSRVKWALYDSSRVRRWEYEIHRHSGALSNVILLLNVRYAGLLQSEVREIKDDILFTQTKRLVPSKEAHSSWTNFIFGAKWGVPGITKLEGLLSSFEDSKHLNYRISLILYALFCLKAVCIDLNLRQNPLFPIGVSFVGARFVVKNVVSQDSELMSSCKKGDVFAVWNLFHSKKASVNDITPENRPPLQFAIESGSVELVSFLLNNGANAAESYGQFHTSPLDSAFMFRRMAVARLLLSNGAESNHINRKGWTPAFNLFGFAKQNHSSGEYIDMLSATSFTEFDIQDGEGWTCMHRAGAFGCANDIISLVKAHASLTIQTFKLSWTPIFCAVQFGNISTFKELRKHQSNLLKMRDLRGWTLLHVAVNAKHLEVMQILISLDADPHAQSYPTEFFVPEDLKGLSVTPGDIARLRGPLVFSAYIAALKAAGHDFEVIKDDAEECEDLFWPALQKEQEV